MSLQHDLWRSKQMLVATRAALEQSAAALAVTRDDVFTLVAAGRLRDVRDVYASGIAAQVIRLDGGIDIDEANRLIDALLRARPELRSTSV